MWDTDRTSSSSSSKTPSEMGRPFGDYRDVLRKEFHAKLQELHQEFLEAHDHLCQCRSATMAQHQIPKEIETNVNLITAGPELGRIETAHSSNHQAIIQMEQFQSDPVAQSCPQKKKQRKQPETSDVPVKAYSTLRQVLHHEVHPITARMAFPPITNQVTDAMLSTSSETVASTSAERRFLEASPSPSVLVSTTSRDEYLSSPQSPSISTKSESSGLYHGPTGYTPVTMSCATQTENQHNLAAQPPTSSQAYNVVQPTSNVSFYLK